MFEERRQLQNLILEELYQTGISLKRFCAEGDAGLIDRILLKFGDTEQVKAEYANVLVLTEKKEIDRKYRSGQNGLARLYRDVVTAKSN